MADSHIQFTRQQYHLLSKFELDPKEVQQFLDLQQNARAAGTAAPGAEPAVNFSAKFFPNLLKMKQYCSKKMADISQVEQT